ncbi:hypothetical protein [Streptomyces bluensis]|uniref:hypothetical protein n=1 Tax=Streptomyces bluensis TaxID=33897 RepID=UPI0016765E3C|nr:hypothetical protein [Streptomyces bluensis]GGZ67384.1 hypothetical protein GCM10010344_38010 [Streptomyces bluensis]
MTNLILRTLDALNVLFAPRGRHRAGHTPPNPVRRQEPSRALRRAPGPYATDAPLDGTATPLVRPYVLTTEQRAQRRAVRLTTHGMDIDSLRIHGVGVV